MINRIVPQLLKQLWEKAFTNPFPVTAMPDSLTEALKKSAEGEIELNMPVPVGDRFRGAIAYDRSACIGCKLCIKVCPANATEYVPGDKKIIIHNDRCCFCAQCVEVCPVKCLSSSQDYLISSYDRKANITVDTGKPVVEEADGGEQKKTVCRIDAEKCIGCTMCARGCPVQCITGQVKVPHVIDEERCVGCGKCAEVCPKSAVSTVEVEG
ncbi:MAG TPA: 4Fe-4S ferredoxin [Synergistaceae bacterium]|jgi:formate hydrogenlyase subunit 6/NADH:ubiquinone oxidoreductase subunit I|nr:4Fe-4S ferredoxin [Synergistaceae bacterium]